MGQYEIEIDIFAEYVCTYDIENCKGKFKADINKFLEISSEYDTLAIKFTFEHELPEYNATINEQIRHTEDNMTTLQESLAILAPHVLKACQHHVKNIDLYLNIVGITADKNYLHKAIESTNMNDIVHFITDKNNHLYFGDFTCFSTVNINVTNSYLLFAPVEGFNTLNITSNNSMILLNLDRATSDDFIAKQAPTETLEFCKRYTHLWGPPCLKELNLSVNADSSSLLIIPSLTTLCCYRKAIQYQAQIGTDINTEILDAWKSFVDLNNEISDYEGIKFEMREIKDIEDVDTMKFRHMVNQIMKVTVTGEDMYKFFLQSCDVIGSSTTLTTCNIIIIYYYHLSDLLGGCLRLNPKSITLLNYILYCKDLTGFLTRDIIDMIRWKSGQCSNLISKSNTTKLEYPNSDKFENDPLYKFEFYFKDITCERELWFLGSYNSFSREHYATYVFDNCHLVIRLTEYIHSKVPLDTYLKLINSTLYLGDVDSLSKRKLMLPYDINTVIKKGRTDTNFRPMYYYHILLDENSGICSCSQEGVCIFTIPTDNTIDVVLKSLYIKDSQDALHQYITLLPPSMSNIFFQTLPIHQQSTRPLLTQTIEPWHCTNIKKE